MEWKDCSFSVGFYGVVGRLEFTRVLNGFKILGSCCAMDNMTSL
jgi:hypothetical protein